ncbi:MAG TPA: hypothetical protein VJM08_05000 [Anaerolineales bacterium]|nr:hypothetical protein [Anaerolineales bacterium]
MAKSSIPPKFDLSVYSKITLNDLVMYSLYTLHKQGSEITPEDAISACFILFPKRFSLRKYPQWPDSAVVRRRWSDCKSKGYLRGSDVKGFKLTAKGIKRAEKLEKSLGSVKLKSSQTVHNELKSRARKYIRAIERSEAYARYKKRLELNEFDFRSLLFCTMESPPATLSRNLEQFKDYVNIHERKDLLTFLEFSEGKFSQLLGNSTKQTKKKIPKMKK